MSPIINPWWIYLAEKSETMQHTFIAIGILALVVIFVENIISMIEGGKTFFKRGACIAAIIVLLFGLLFPSQKTVLTMMTVQQLTPTNIEIVGNTIEDTVDYIVEKIEDIIEEDE